MDGGGDTEHHQHHHRSLLPVFLTPAAQAEFETQRLKEDLETLADDDASAFDRVPIEKFGEAMLRGMGWTPGATIGNYASGFLLSLYLSLSLSFLL